MKSLILIAGVSLMLTADAFAQRLPAPPAPPRAPTAPGAPTAPPLLDEFNRTMTNGIGRAFQASVGGNYLGIYTDDLTAETRARLNLSANSVGVHITDVAPDSPAARAGLRKDDVIVRLDGERVTNTAKLTRLISEAAPESSLRLTVNRAGGEQELSATLGRRENAARFNPGSFPGGEAFRNFPPPNTAEIERQRREFSRRAQEMGARAGELNLRSSDLLNLYSGSTRRLGVSTVPLTNQLADYFDVKNRRGVLVTNVAENSAAQRAGIKAGDVVIEIDNAQVASTGDLSRGLSRARQSEVELRIVRKGRERTIRATPEASREFSFNFEEFAPGMFFGEDAPPAPTAPIAPTAPPASPVPPTPPVAPRGRTLR